MIKQLIEQTRNMECLLGVQGGRFKYQTINIVIPILFIFNLFLINRLSIKIILLCLYRTKGNKLKLDEMNRENEETMENEERVAFAKYGDGGHQKGLTKREYFAGLAMQSLISANKTSRTMEDYRLIANHAVACAEALLQELNDQTN